MNALDYLTDEEEEVDEFLDLIREHRRLDPRKRLYNKRNTIRFDYGPREFRERYIK